MVVKKIFISFVATATFFNFVPATLANAAQKEISATNDVEGTKGNEDEELEEINNLEEDPNEDIDTEENDEQEIDVRREAAKEEEEIEEVVDEDNDDENADPNSTTEEEAVIQVLSDEQTDDGSLNNIETTEEVIELQQNLKTLGFMIDKEINGLFDEAMKEDVKLFQNYFGLNETEIADEDTLAKIEEILSNPLRNGQRHEDAIQLKINLANLGYHISNNPTTLYGTQTDAKVREFQEDHGLRVNGIADEVTLAKIDELLSIPMQTNVYRNDVVTLKINLSTLGFHVSNNPTPLYGPLTEQAVRDFQQYYGLTVNGVADEATLNKIDEILSSPFRNGKRHESTITLKVDLDKLGHHISDNPTTLYASQTAAAVEDFQRRYNLRVNGIADPVTLAKIQELLKAPLANGLYRYDVVDLKVNLEKLGFGVSNNPTIFFGPITERTVREFQEYYGLQVTGVANNATLSKISEVLSSPLRNGQRHEAAVQLKLDLARFGYHVSNNPTTLYGTQTEQAVREFQERYGLRVSGIADEITLAKIAELIESGVGQEIITYTQYNLTLAESAARQSSLNPPPQTDLYRTAPGLVHSSVVDIVERGVITGSSVNLRRDATTQSSSYGLVPIGTTFTIEETVTGQNLSGNDKWFKINYQGETLYVHTSLASSSSVAVVKQNNTRVREAANTNSHNFGSVSKDTELVVLREVSGTSVSGSTKWYEVRFRTWRDAKPEHFMPYLDPNQNDRFQHLVLDATAGVTASQLNSVLSGRGILNGMGQAFITAGTTHSVNEIYLIAHALLETGNGTSGLATGIEVGRNNNGNLVLVTSSNRSSLSNIRTTYNMFGIGAVDSDPYRLGAIYAYNAGWFTPEAAIVGGAAFISNSYFARGQNTLYKMRWNHAYPSQPGGTFFPQYATDMGWAVKQVPRIKSLYDQLDNPTLRFDIVQYR